MGISAIDKLNPLTELHNNLKILCRNYKKQAARLGTAQLEFASGGWPVWQGQFGPFGESLDSQATTNNYKYTGLERDGESNLDHAQFRQLEYLQGRWMSADPYDGSMDFANPQSLNRYSYVGNMPLNFTDPSGLNGEASGGGLGKAGGCVGAIASEGASVPADLECAYELYNIISGLFHHPRLSASVTPRPHAHVWDEHGGYKVKPFSGIGDILGLQGGGCEFGPCGGGASGFTQGHGNCTPWLGVGCQPGQQIDWAKVGCFLEGFAGSLIDFGQNSPPGKADVLRTARTGLEMATPRLMTILRGSKAADEVPILGQVLMVAQGGLAISDGVEAVHNCKGR